MSPEEFRFSSCHNDISIGIASEGERGQLDPFRDGLTDSEASDSEAQGAVPAAPVVDGPRSRVGNTTCYVWCTSSVGDDLEVGGLVVGFPIYFIVGRISPLLCV